MLLAEATPAPAVAEAATGTVTLLLETPAILSDPTCADTPVVQYARYFKEQLGATLVKHRATRRMAGEYYGFRFRAYGPDRYLPFELTEAGAVFVLEVTDAHELAAALAKGLEPVALRDGKLHGLKWQECPFKAANGYGEISLCPDVAGMAKALADEAAKATKTTS